MTNPIRRVTRRDSLRVWDCQIRGLPKGIAKTISDGGILPGFLKCVDIKEDGTLEFEYVTGPEREPDEHHRA